MNRKKHRTRRQLIRDYSLYLLISVAIVAVAIWAAKRSVAEETIHTWGSFAFATPILFGFFVAEYRRLWRKRLFWLVTFALLALHSLGYAVVFARVSPWRGSWTFILTLIEAFIFLQCRNWLWPLTPEE
jgi:hypothetical protein